MCVTLAACDSGGSDEPKKAKKATVLARDDAALEPDWQADLDVIGQPEVAEGVAVVLVKAPKKRIAIVAVDVSTGEQLWTKPWSPGGVPPGFGVAAETFTSASGRALTVFSDPGSDSPSPEEAEAATRFFESIVVADLRTGEEVHRLEPTRISTPLSPCSDEKDACFDGYGDDGGLRIDLDSGKISTAAADAPPKARNIGDQGLFATDDRPGEQIGVYRDGATLWSTPLADVMGPGVSSDGGWEFGHDETTDRYIGYMRQPPPKDIQERARAGKGYSIDAGGQTLVALDGKTGTVLWKKEDATTSCVGLDTESDAGVRCVVGGTITYPGDGEKGTIADPTTSVEGFDPETGETTWTVALSPAAAESVVFSSSAHLSDGRTLVLDTVGGAKLVAVRDGTSRKVSATAVFACEGETIELAYAVPFIVNGDSNDDRYGGAPVTPCLADDAPAPSFTASSVRDGGQDAGEGVYVLATDGGLVGYTVTE